MVDSRYTSHKKQYHENKPVAMHSENYDAEEMTERKVWKKIWGRTTTTVGLLTSHFEGEDNVMACEWAIQVSFRPVQFLVVVGKSKKTAELILKSQEFGLTFASDKQAHLSHVAGSYSGHNVDKFALEDFKRRPGKKIKAPIILGGMVAVECEVIHTLELDERYIFVGQALHAEIEGKQSPLIYHNGKYYGLGKNIPKN